MKNIVLYGMRGVGKTTIAKALARETGLPYYDLDDLIKDNIGEAIFTYIETHGREKFREKEHESLAKILDKDENKILALGGGAITFENNQDILLKKVDKLIYLEAPLETILERIQSDEEKGNKRSALTEKGLLEELTEVYEERKLIYETFYDFKVEAIAEVDQVVKNILERIIDASVIAKHEVD